MELNMSLNPEFAQMMAELGTSLQFVAHNPDSMASIATANDLSNNGYNVEVVGMDGGSKLDSCVGAFNSASVENQRVPSVDLQQDQAPAFKPAEPMASMG